jgi:hypothetical protein
LRLDDDENSAGLLVKTEMLVEEERVDMISRSGSTTVKTTRMMWWTTPAPGIECPKGVIVE